MSFDRMSREDYNEREGIENSRKPLWEQYSIKQLEDALSKARSMEAAKKKADVAAKLAHIARLEEELKQCHKYFETKK